MPTTEPLDPDDDAEGQLKPIVALTSQPDIPATRPDVRAPQTVSTAPATASATATARVAPVPATARVASAPAAAPRGRLRTSLNTPGLSLTPRKEEKTDSYNPAASQRRKTPFADEAFEEAWKRYIDTNTTNHLVINTMRAHPAIRLAGTDSFEMVVDSPPQVELMLEALPQLLDHLRNTLANDMITLKVRASEGTTSPLTWNEREVLADITERHPILQTYITTLKLTLD